MNERSKPVVHRVLVACTLVVRLAVAIRILDVKEDLLGNQWPGSEDSWGGGQHEQWPRKQGHLMGPPQAGQWPPHDQGFWQGPPRGQWHGPPGQHWQGHPPSDQRHGSQQPSWAAPGQTGDNFEGSDDFDDSDEPSGFHLGRSVLGALNGGGQSCRKLEYQVEEIVPRASEWCSIDRVPVDERAPAKLQGLFWHKGYSGSSIVTCMTLGKWDASTRTLTLPVYEAIMWKTTPQAKYLQSQLMGRVYVFKFNAALNYADISPSGTGGLTMIQGALFADLMSWTMREMAGAPGEKWDRISYTNTFPKTEIKYARYQAWRLMNGSQRASPNITAVFLRASRQKDDMKDGGAIMQ